MLVPWLADPTTKNHLDRLNHYVDFDLIEAGTEADAKFIKNTRIAQPLIFAASLVSAYAAVDRGYAPNAATGHSVGEWCASVLAGVLADSDAMTLVAARGNAMAMACDQHPTGLAAVLGGERTEIITTAAAHNLSVANDNGYGQIVFGGTLDDLDRFAGAAPGRSRVRILEVAGAFHTSVMEPAVSSMRQLAASVDQNDARIPVISNLDGAVLTDGREILNRMIDQIALPVRWDLVMQTMAALGASTTLELSPSGTLTGIVRRALNGVTTLQVDTPADIEELPVAHRRSNDLAGVVQ
jgi:[acyl-carrier-protein] S-malonyltransferase